MEVCQGHLHTDQHDLTKRRKSDNYSEDAQTVADSVRDGIPTRRWSIIPVLSGHDAHWTSGVSHDVRTVVLAIVFTVWATFKKMSMMMMMMSLGTYLHTHTPV